MHLLYGIITWFIGKVNFYSVAASAPAITGTTRGTDDNSGNWTGCFYEAGVTGNCSGSFQGTYGGFNASRSSSIYGASNTIRPVSRGTTFLIRY